MTPALIAIHSFTPFFDQQARPWEIGVLWDTDPRIPLPLIRGLRNKGVIVVPSKMRILWWLFRIHPGLFDRTVAKGTMDWFRKQKTGQGHHGS